jgi:hypothetical protein
MPQNCIYHPDQPATHSQLDWFGVFEIPVCEL